jgi:glycosyltransferase involved in cell wall biosynthesis
VRACINSQTPFVKFKLSYNELLDKYGSLSDPLDLSELEAGVDYDFSPGGVTAMVYPLVRRLMSAKGFSKVVWVSLGVNYPPRVLVGDILVSHVEMDERVLRSYTVFKENLWSEIHGLSTRGKLYDGYTGYARYNWENARTLLDFLEEADVFYVQDFQLLLTGPMIGPSAPAVLRWHVPFMPENLQPLTHRFIVKAMEGFDGIVVSTRRDLEGLIKSGYGGRAHQVYPFVDPDEWREPPPSSALESVSEKTGLRKNENLLLIVARMDRIKSQDVAIRALSHLTGRGQVRLALVGDGSFSSSTKGGLGHGKGASWRSELEALVKELGLQENVSFLGYLSRDEVKAAYYLASVILLTSRLEGFGISVLEGWLNKKPVVVSRGAGVSELVIDGSNGFTFPEGDDSAAAEAILKALGPGGEKLGETGYESSKQCWIEVAQERELGILEEAMSAYR